MNPQTQRVKDGMEAIARAIREGVGYIEARADDLPKEISGPTLILIDDRGRGPQAWNAENLLRSAYAIQLVEDGYPFDGKIVADMARRGVFVLISCGPTFRAWYQYLETLGVLDNALAQGFSDPTGRLQ